MSNERLIAMLYFQLKGDELKIDLDGFANEFDNRHDRIMLHWLSWYEILT